MSAYLYRAKDEAGKMLYIGITTQPHKRLATHANSAPWRHLSRPELEWVEFPDMPAARAAEREEIIRHRPAYNKACNPDVNRWGVIDPVRVNILVPKEDRKRWKLAALDRGISLGALIEQVMHKYKTITKDRP